MSWGTSWVDRVVLGGLALLLLLLPFAFSVSMTDCFPLPKEILARVGLALLTGIFVWRFYVEGGVRLAFTPVDKPLICLLGYSALSLFWNFNAVGAITDLRMIALLLLMIPLIVNTVRSRRQFGLLLWMMTFAGVGTSMLGIMEAWDLYFRYTPGDWPVFARAEVQQGLFNLKDWYIPFFPELVKDDRGMGGSIISTLGNRNFLATFAMVTSFISLGLVFASGQRLRKVLSFACFAIMVSAIAVTRCRAALLGLVAGLVFVVFAVALLGQGTQMVKRFRGISIAVVVLLLLGVFYGANTAKMPSFFEKIKGTFTLDSTGSTFDRFQTWYVTWRSFSGEPIKWLVGNGFGSFKHWFELLRSQVLEEATKERLLPIVYRQAHNDWLQAISELGLIGLGLLLFACFTWFGSLYRFLLGEIQRTAGADMAGDHLLLLCLGGGMVAVLTAAIPDFPLHRIETAVVTLAILAMGMVLAETRCFAVRLPELRRSSPTGSHLLIPVLVLVVAVVSVYTDWNMNLADRMVMRADVLRRAGPFRGDGAEIPKLLTKAIALDPCPGWPYVLLASVRLSQDGVQEAISLTLKGWKNLHMSGQTTYQQVLRGLTDIASQDLQNPELAMFFAEQSLKIATGKELRASVHFLIAKLAAKAGLLERTEEALRKVADCPAYVSQIPIPLAMTLGARGKWAEALALGAPYSVSINHTNAELLNEIGVWANNLQQWATASAALERATALEPGNILYKLNQATILLGAGELEGGFKVLETLHRGSGLSAVGRAEVTKQLASTAALLFRIGAADLQTGRRNAGLQKLLLVRQSPYLDEETRQRIEFLVR